MTDEKKDKLELGDVVVLKSGGPRMTVAQKKSTGNLWWCMYFVGGDLKELKSDLCAARWKLTPRGIQIESKDDIIIS